MSAGKKAGAGPSSRITRKHVLQAASRYYELGDTQSAIAKDMGISPSYLARLLQAAKENGWVRIFVDSDRETELAAELQSKFPQLMHVEVIPTAPSVEGAAQPPGTVAAAWFNDLLDKDEENGDPQILLVAVGASVVQQYMVEQVVRRQNRISVGPTSLTPSPAKLTRLTAPIVATKLADRLGALSPLLGGPAGKDRQGYLYCPTLVPPRNNLSALRAWFRDMRQDPEYLDMLRFWNQVDIAFVGVATLDHFQGEMKDRLRELGVSFDSLIERGARVLFVNRFLDENGNDVPLIEGVTSYDVVMPTEAIKAVVSRHEPSHGRRGYVMLSAWGKQGEAAAPVIRAGLANVLLCDAGAASLMLGTA